MNYLAAYQEEFSRAFPRFIDAKIKGAQTLHPQAGGLALIIREFAANGGKRFRPALFFNAYGSAKTGIDPLLFSFVFELFHTFALIHDDIIDHAPLRRGKPTVNEKYGLGEAVLSGDLALMLADEVFTWSLAGCTLAGSRKRETAILWNMFKQELMAGQYLDYIRTSDPEAVMLLKTSRYSFVRPVQFGFYLAGREGEFGQWEAPLRQLGVLFQLKDDYEGIFAAEKDLGKSNLSDIREGKNTRLMTLFREKAAPQEKEKLASFFGRNTAGEADLIWVRKTLEEKGVRGQVKNEIRQGALTLRDGFAPLEKASPELHGLIAELISLITDIS